MIGSEAEWGGKPGGEMRVDIPLLAQAQDQGLREEM